MKKLNFGKFVVSNRWFGILLCVAILASSGYGFKFFKYDPSAESNFDRHSAIFLEHEKLNTIFHSADVLVLHVEFSDTVFKKDNYGLIGDLTRSAGMIAGVSRVSSLTNTAIPSAGADGEMVVGYLDSKYDISTPEGIDSMRKYVMGSNLTKGVMVSQDGKSAAIYASVSFPVGGDVAAIQKSAYEDIVELKKAFTDICGNRCSIEFNGKLVEEIEMTRVAAEAMPVAVVIQNLALLLTLAALTSSIRAAAFVCVLSTIGSVVAIGFVSLLGHEFNSFSVSAGGLICAILFSQSIHLVWQYLRNLSADLHPGGAMIEAVNTVYLPTIATTAVTLVAYFSIATSQSPAMFTYGLSLAVGGVAGVLLILFFLPHCLLFIKKKPKYLFTDYINLSGLGVIIGRHHIFLLLMFALPMTAGALVALKSTISEFPRGMLLPTNEYRISADKIDESFGGSSSVSYIIYADDSGTVEGADLIDAITKFTSWSREQHGVSNVTSVSDIIFEINKSVASGDKKMTDDDVSDAFFVYRLALPYGADTNEIVSADRKMVKLRISFFDSHTHVVTDFVDKANKELGAMGVKGSPAGLSYIFASFMRDFAKQEIYSFVGLIFSVFCFMSFFYRSVLLGAVVAIPLAIPVACGIGISYLYGGIINLVVCSSMGITIGLVVDETMHVVTGFFDRLKGGVGAEEAGRGVIACAGPGIVIAFLVLCFGFISCSFGEWANYGVVAKLVSMILALSVVFQFFILVPALIFFNRNK